MSEQFNITLYGKEKGEEFIDPTAIVAAVKSMIESLKQVDEQSWKPMAPRQRWGLTNATTNSPLLMSFGSKRVGSPDASEPESVRKYVCLLRNIEDGDDDVSLPSWADDAMLKRTRNMMRDLGETRIEITGTGVDAPYMPSDQLGKKIDRIRKRPWPSPYEQYGSIDGEIRRGVLDNREGHKASNLEIIDRLTGNEVKCQVTPEQVREIGHLGQRVVLFGIIKYTHDNQPIKIEVETFKTINPNPPSIRSMKGLGLSITGGQDAADYVQELRGNIG